MRSLISFRTTNGLAANGWQEHLTRAGDDVEYLLKYASNRLGDQSKRYPTFNDANPVNESRIRTLRISMRKPRLFLNVCSAILLLAASASTARAQSGVIQFSQPTFDHSESNFITVGATKYLTPSVTVTRTGGSVGEVSANYCVWPSEVADNALENQNYALADNMRRWVAAGTLTWADGDSTPKTLPFNYFVFGEFRYNLFPSPLVQGTITYSARLVTPLGGATLGTNATARLNILDAEAPAPGVLNLSSRRFYGPEGGSAAITVSRTGGSTGPVSVTYATGSNVPAGTPSQANIGIGVAGAHYIATSGTLTWGAGDTADKTFTVPLPATGFTSGSLNVAVNLSSPTNSAVLGTVPSAILTIQNTASTVFDINDSTDSSTYRVSLPSGPGPVRGVLFWWPGTNGDDRHFTTDPNFRKIADQWRFAIASPRGNYDTGPNRAEFPQPKLGFLFDRLSQVALVSGHPEILNAPFVLSGMSAGSYSSSQSLQIWPERTIAAVCQEGWSNPPFPFSSFVLNPLTKEIPVINLGGQNEGTQSPPSSIFPAMNYFQRAGLSRSAAVICWGRGHTFSNTGASYNAMGLYWLDQVMAAGRYPLNLAPTTTTAPPLGSLPISSGWWGARNSTNTKGSSNFYELPGGSSRFLNIGPDSTYTGIKDSNNPLVDSWLPTESTARVYRAFVSLPSISFSAPAQFSSGLVGNPVTLSISENGYGSGITKVEFFDDHVKIGEDTSAPFAMTWSPTVAGARGITAVAYKSSGPTYSAFTVFLASDPIAPTLAIGQKFGGIVNTPFTYQLISAGPPTSYAVASGTLPPGVTLDPSTGLISGSPTIAGTYTPAFTATNSVGTSSPVTVTLTVDATAGLVIQESFAYNVGTNDPDPDAGLNSSNGLPATNVGGNPAGTSTGLRGNWGTSTDVVAGLTYAQGGKTLITSGGAGRVNNATWGSGTPYIYRLMTTDPHIALRIGNNGSLGPDGSSIYLSLIGSTSSSTASAFRFSLRYDGLANFYVQNTATGWSLNGANATGAPLALNTPTLFVLRMDFVVGSNDSVSLWVNPPLGQALGAPNATVSGINFPGLNNFQTNAAVANAMTFDEFRIGNTLAAVTPFTVPSALDLFRATNGLASDGSQDLQAPADDGVANLLKFAFNMLGSGVGQGTTLATPNAAVLTPGGTAGLPLIGIGTGGDAGKLQLTYIRRKSATTSGITYAVACATSCSVGILPR